MKNSDWAGIALCVLAVFATGAAFAEPISISTIEDLQKIGSDAAYPLNGDYVLTQNIDATATATWNDGKGFEPIGTVDGFSGVLDGNGYVLTGLSIWQSDLSSVALIGYLDSGGVVKDLILENATITGADYVGALVGKSNKGTVERCHATVTVVGGSNVGGLVGMSSYATVVTDSSASGTVTGADNANFVGGLVGSNKSQSGITGSHADCSVFGSGSLGGLCGYNESLIVRCYASGDVMALTPLTSDCAGGLVGAGIQGSISDSYATGSVTGGVAGGLIGNNYRGMVTRCYATGKPTIAWPTFQTIGGLIGQTGGTVVSSYWNRETTEQATSVGSNSSFGKTTDEMKDPATFVDWDFATTWDMDGATNAGYPFLRTDAIVEGESPVEGQPPAEGEDAEGQTPTEGQAPSEGQSPAEGQTPSEGQVSPEGQSSIIEGEASAQEGEAETADKPQSIGLNCNAG